MNYGQKGSSWASLARLQPWSRTLQLLTDSSWKHVGQLTSALTAEMLERCINAAEQWWFWSRQQQLALSLKAAANLRQISRKSVTENVVSICNVSARKPQKEKQSKEVPAEVQMLREVAETWWKCDVSAQRGCEETICRNSVELNL